MARIFVGNLPSDIKEKELDDLFYKYGRIREIDIKTPQRPPAFAFISFSDYRDAEDAVRGRDGYNYDGYRLRVEVAKGDRRGDRDDRRDDRGSRRAGASTGGRRTDFGVIITNLPKGCSWQDLKDFMRKAGDVVYADVDKYGEGVVEFSNRSDMDNAVRDLDDTEFKSFNDSSYIRVRLANKKADRSEERDDDRGRRGGKAARSRTPSRSRSRDRVADRKRSVSRSRSRSGSPDDRKRSGSDAAANNNDDSNRDRERERERDREEDR